MIIVGIVWIFKNNRIGFKYLEYIFKKRVKIWVS